MKLSAPLFQNTIKLNGCTYRASVYPESSAIHIHAGGERATRHNAEAAADWLIRRGCRTDIARVLVRDPRTDDGRIALARVRTNA